MTRHSKHQQLPQWQQPQQVFPQRQPTFDPSQYQAPQQGYPQETVPTSGSHLVGPRPVEMPPQVPMYLPSRLPGMTWGQAAKEFYIGSDTRTKAIFKVLFARVALIFLRVLPAPVSALVAGNDAFGFVFDDPALIVTVPLTILMILQALWRIPKIHREGNQHNR